MEQYQWKSAETSFQQGMLGSSLTAQLMHFDHNGQGKWYFKIFDGQNHVYEGDLQETIELILLGKVVKAQFQQQVTV